MEFDCRFGLAVGGPGKQRQAQFDECGIECIDGLGQIECERLVGIELPGCGDQRLSELGVDAPITASIGIGQRFISGKPQACAVIVLKFSRKPFFKLMNSLLYATQVNTALLISRRRR